MIGSPESQRVKVGQTRGRILEGNDQHAKRTVRPGRDDDRSAGMSRNDSIDTRTLGPGSSRMDQTQGGHPTHEGRQRRSKPLILGLNPLLGYGLLGLLDLGRIAEWPAQAVVVSA